MKTQAEPDESYDDDFYENQPLESCPSCGRSYDDIDFDYQSCSKCGWDADEGVFKSYSVRHPSNNDYMNGEADIATGEWI